MEFLNPYYAAAVIAVIAFYYVKSKKPPFSKEVAKKIIIKGKISKKTKFHLLSAAFVLFVAALSRPVINNGFTTVKAPVQNIVIGLDISKGMEQKDLYPDREHFAVQKIKTLLKHLNHQNVALVLFDKKTYLISPPSSDYESLIYLLEHTDTKNILTSVSPDVYSFVTSAYKLVKNPKIVMFTWGGEDLQKALAFVKEKKLKTYAYICARKNSPYPPNPQLKEFDGYFTPSYSDENIKKLAEILNRSKQKDIKIMDKRELFYYPLALGILILFFVIFFPLRRGR